MKTSSLIVCTLAALLNCALCAQYGGYAEYSSSCSQWNQNYYYKLDTCMLISGVYKYFACSGIAFEMHNCGTDNTCASCSVSSFGNSTCTGGYLGLCPSSPGVPAPPANAVVTTTCYNSTTCDIEPDSINQKSVIGCFPGSEFLSRYTCSADGSTVTYNSCGYPQCSSCSPAWNLTMGCSNTGLLTNYYSTPYWQNLSCVLVGPLVSPSPIVAGQTPSPSVTPSSSPVPSVSPTPDPAISPSSSRSPSPSPSVSTTPTLTPSVTPSTSPSISPSTSLSPTPSVSPTPMMSVSPGTSGTGGDSGMSNSGPSGNNSGEIAAAVLIPVGVVGIVGGAAFLFYKRKQKKQTHTLLGA